MESYDIIKESHRLHGDTMKLRNYYRSWAETYDRDVANERYTGPRVITDIVVLIAGIFSVGRDATFMDAGCGTGLVGIELAEAGFYNISGFDLSKEMATKAEKTKKYHSVMGGVDVTALPSKITNESYDLVVCCGVFTIGHVEPEALSNLLSIVKQNGYVVFSARCSYMQETDFEKRFDAVLKRAGARIILHLRNVVYIAEEGADYWVIGI